MEYGFIRDMMDVKVLILYVAARCEYPLDQEQMYALCFQDDCVSYFDICTAIVQLTKSGHLTEVEKGKYVITEKGRQDGEITADSIAATVRKKAAQAVEKYNKDTSRKDFRETQVIPRGNGDYTARMTLKDTTGTLMTIELLAPNQNQAVALTRAFREKAEIIYNLLLEDLLEE